MPMMSFRDVSFEFIFMQIVLFKNNVITYLLQF